MESKKTKLARFNARLPIEQKELFDYAANIGGYRSLTDFILLTAQEKAKEIIKEKEQIVFSKVDAEIFFDAIVNAKDPSPNLIKAFKEYQQYLSNQ
jgi:uncharacterized protein (DUF1778 family)